MSSLIAFCYKASCYLVYLLPRRCQLFLGDVIAVVFFDGFRVRRKLVMEHLKTAFPDKSEAERVGLARASFKNLGRGLIEYCNVPFITQKNFHRYFVIEGKNFADQALAQGKGICGLSLHLGNGDYGLCGMALAGLPVHLISKHFKWKWLDELWFGVRREFGVKFIPEEKSSYQILKALKENEIVIFVLDQFMGPPAGLQTTFFGKETGTAAGLSLFATRKSSPVLPFYSYRRADGIMRIIIEPPLTLVQGDSLPETLAKSTQAYTEYIESLVRKYPDQWMWLHRRWKTFEVR